MSTMTDQDIIAWARDWADQLASARQFAQEEKYRRLADLAEKGAALRENVCVIGGQECPKHGHAHGREAEELRGGVERLMALADHGDVSSTDLQTLLDRTDARDSLAYLEAGDVGDEETEATDGPLWAMGYTDSTGTIVFDCCEAADFADDAAELLGGDAPMGLWHWEGTIRGFEWSGGDYDCEAVGKFSPTTAKLAKNGEVCGD